MPSERSLTKPKLYFLNERHQRSPAEKTGGGRQRKVVDFDWASHGNAIKNNLNSIKTTRAISPDPTSRKRVFVLAAPNDSIQKSSTAKGADDGKKEYKIQVRGKDSQTIERIGFDLLAVNQDGSAIVHATEQQLDQMILSLNHLEELKQQEQNRWAHINSLGEIPLEYKASLAWWSDSDQSGDLWQAAIDLQPLLSRAEIDEVVQAIKDALQPEEKLLRIDREFSGRARIVSLLSPVTIMRLAESFQSIFSIHPPLEAVTIGNGDEISPVQLKSQSTNQEHLLPCVAFARHRSA